MSEKNYNFILAGVGGQGTILAGDILADVGLAAGFETKKSEVHGMAQRGGAVECQVRWAKDVASPLVERGKVDFLLGFEKLEAARWADYLSGSGMSIVNDYAIAPPAVNLGLDTYPDDQKIESLLTKKSPNLWWVDGIGTIKKLGANTPALAGVVLLGTLSSQLDVDEQIWLDVIKSLVPAKFVELNVSAFQEGRRLGIEKNMGNIPQAE